MAARKTGRKSSSKKSSSSKKKSSSRGSSTKSPSSGKKPTGRKYGKKAQSEVRTEMHHLKKGEAGHKNRKQAIAIGLSKARKKGAKVPRKRASSKKSSSRKS